MSERNKRDNSVLKCDIELFEKMSLEELPDEEVVRFGEMICKSCFLSIIYDLKEDLSVRERITLKDSSMLSALEFLKYECNKTILDELQFAIERLQGVYTLYDSTNICKIHIQNDI